MRSHRLLVVPLAMAVLAGCAPVAWSSLAPAPLSSPPVPPGPSLTLDGGALRVVPAPGARARWGSAQEALTQASGAISALAMPDDGATLVGPAVSLARVTIRSGLPRSGGQTVTDQSGHAAAYTDRLAWVVTLRVTGGRAPSCPAMRARSTGAPLETGHEGYVVVVQDATHGGDAAAYTERRHAVCQEGYVGPSVDVPRRLLSVPWQLRGTSAPTRRSGAILGSAAVTYVAPGCARPAGTGGGGGFGSSTTLSVLVIVPLGPLCAGSRTLNATYDGVGHPVPAPLGPLGVYGRTIRG